MPDPIVLAGLSCGEVLTQLSNYLDDELDRELRARIELHLRGCDWCARFGGEFSAVIGALRDRLRSDAPDPVQARLDAHLDSLFPTAPPDPER